MKSIISLLIVGSLAAAQEKTPPKNDQVIALLKELRPSKDPLDTVRTFTDKQKQLDDETVKLIADIKNYRIDTEIPRITLYVDWLEKFVKAKRNPEATATLDIVEELYEREYQRLEASAQYFGGAFLGGSFQTIGDYRIALGQKEKANTLYVRSLACLKKRVHYDIAHGDIKSNEEAVKVLRQKIAKLNEEPKK